MYPIREPRKIDTGFNKPASYGPHEGLDFNLTSGGNSDCGIDIFCVYPGEVIHASDSTANYGRLVVIECNTPRGTRWVRYCHLDEKRIVSGSVKRGEVIGTMGSTGNSSACHLHLDVLKKKPSNWRFYSKSVLDWFEDPEIIINEKVEEENMIPKWLTTLLQERGLTIDDEAQIRVIFDEARRYKDEVPDLKQQVVSANEALSEKTQEVAVLVEKNQKLTDRATELQEQANQARSERDKADWEAKQANVKVKSLEEELEVKNNRISELEKENPLMGYSWFERLKSLFRR